LKSNKKLNLDRISGTLMMNDPTNNAFDESIIAVNKSQLNAEDK
jgi:hypothetical protein|tara:strand:- start:622 stop:753 length:132 start_codon:yes stop_codon:yes gene_type:complete